MMRNKKASTTMTTMVVSILVIMALFYGTFNYISSNYESADITLPLNYSNSYDDLKTSEANLNDSILQIKNAAQNISEGDGGVLSVAWNGLSGIAATIRLFFDIIDVAISVWNAILPGLAFLPSWVKVLMEMGIIITLVLLIVGAFKGETKT